MKTKRNAIQIWLVLLALSILNLQFTAAFAQPVTKIAVGGHATEGHTLFLKSDGSLWAMGGNEWGQLGDGTFMPTNRPEQIVASNVTVIAAGEYHSLFLKNDGSLWAMGDNALGELGDGTTNGVNVPEQIVSSGVTAIAAGSQISFFTKNDGSLWTMGYNLDNFVINTNVIICTTVPQQIVSSGVTTIAATYKQVLFLKNDSSLWAMGWNGAGQLGDGTYNSTNQPQQILSGGVTAIAVGEDDTLFLKSDGSLWGMGFGGEGQLGVGATSFNNSPVLIAPPGSGITVIAEDVDDTIFLTSDGSLWGMGWSSFGQLGGGRFDAGQFEPVQYYQPVQIVTGGVTAIAAGYEDTLFIKSDGSLWGLGDNYIGQLGLGDYVPPGYGGTNDYNANSKISPWLINQPMQILAAYNQIFGQLLTNGDMQLSFVGIANANYALDRSASLSLPNWIPQATNSAVGVGAMVFTNTPDQTTNNFWRIRSVP